MNHNIAVGSISARILIVLSLLCCASISFAAVNYDTAWTFVYDGGRATANKAIIDDFRDVKSLPDGSTVYVGTTADSNSFYGIHLLKLDKNGKVLFNKKLNGTSKSSFDGNALCIAKNGDFIIGGMRYADPWLGRTDSQGNVKWSTWFYDSIKKQSFVSGSHINCVKETRHGTIICAVGEQYPPSGSTMENYVGYIEFDTTGKVVYFGENNNPTGNKVGGFYIEQVGPRTFMFSGNQAMSCMDSAHYEVCNRSYTFSLSGVGTVTNNIMRMKMLRDGSLMALGQAYEEDCWDNWKRYYWDVWYSPISYPGGTNSRWLTAGVRGADDIAYDFTQLVNGNLVFVGKGGSTTSGGVWAFVTDSTGNEILWDKNFPIPYKTAYPRAPVPLSVCATPDSGFTVAGEYATHDSIGGMNAFAAHFVPSPVSAVSKKSPDISKTPTVRVNISWSRVIFALPEQFAKEKMTLQVFDERGKRVGENSNFSTKHTIIWNCGRAGAGVYVYSIKNGKTELRGTFAVQR